MGSKSDFSKRPWQGTLLGVISSIGVLILIVVFVGLLLVKETVIPYLTDTPFALLLSAGVFVTLFIMMAAIILGFFIAKGIFYGRTWSVVLAILLTGMSFVEAVFALSIYEILGYSIMLYLGIVCVRHSYYSK